MEFLEQQICTHIWFKVCMVSIMQVKCNLHIIINNVIQNIEQIQYCTMNNYTLSSILCSNTYVTIFEFDSLAVLWISNYQDSRMWKVVKKWVGYSQWELSI